MPGNPEIDALMALAAQQQGAGAGAAPVGQPGSPGPGAGPQAPSGGGPQMSPGQQPQPPNPLEAMQMALMLMAQAGAQLGILESVKKAVGTVTKGLQNMYKDTPGGRQNAAMGQATPQSTPPGVGPMPGMPMT